MRYKVFDEATGKPGPTRLTLLMGDPLTPISVVEMQWPLTYAEALAAGIDPANAIDPQDPTYSSIVYTRYRFADLPFDQRVPPFRWVYFGTQALSVQGDGQSVRAVVTISSPFQEFKHYSIPMNGLFSSDITLSHCHSGVYRYQVKLYNSVGAYRELESSWTVTKDQTMAINLNVQGPLMTESSASIERMAVVQAVQNDQGSLPVIAGKSGVLRVWLADAVGATLDAGVRCTVSAWIPSVGPRPVATNVTLLKTHFSGGSTGVKKYLEFPLDPTWIQPGMTFTTSLIIPSKGTVTQTYSPNVVTGREIDLEVFEIRPYPGASGVPAARDATALREQVVKWAEAMMPIKQLNIHIRGTVIVPADLVYPSLPWDPPKVKYSLVTGLPTLALTMDNIAASEGQPTTGRKIYLGLINDQYSDTGDVTGMTPFGLPGVALFLRSQENARTTLAHEIGHAFGLWHTPTPGANAFPNRIDNGYPYSGDGYIAFTMYDPIGGVSYQNSARDLMGYPSNWPSDYTWQRYYDRVNQMAPMNLAATPVFKAPKDANGSLLFGPPEFAQTLRGQQVEADICGAPPMKDAAGRVIPELPFEQDSQASKLAPLVPFAIVDRAVFNCLPAGVRHSEAPKKVKQSPLELVVVPTPKPKENR